MKHWVVLSLFVFSASYCLAQGKALDAAFGSNGVVTTPIKYGSYEEVSALCCQSDNKVLAAGRFGSATPGGRSVIVRYNTNGTVDQGFGAAGQVQMAYTGKGMAGSTMLGIQKKSGVEHAILAEMQTDPFSSWISLLMARYKPGGTQDTSFGTSGWAQSNDIYAYTMAICPDGKILFTGHTDTVTQFNLFRFLPDGQPDNSFGINARVSRQDTFSGVAKAIAVQADGKILLGGHTFIWPAHPSPHMAVVRYKADGAVDSAFGVNGLSYPYADTAHSAEISSIALQSDGKILICAAMDTGTGSYFYIARLLPDGTLDASFGHGGAEYTAFGNTQGWATDMAVQSDDKIYVTGYASPGANLDYTTALVRYTPNGIVDSTFGVNGRDTTNIGQRSLAYAIAIAPDHRVITAGESWHQRPGELTSDFLLLRYLSGLELGIIDLNTISKPVLYPNPVSSVMNLSYEIEKADILSMHLTDMTGRTVQVFKHNERTGAGKHVEVLQVNNTLASGQYILQIAGTSGAYAIKLQVMN